MSSHRPHHAEGVTCNSRGQRPRSTQTISSDPERVGYYPTLCDPFRVANQFGVMSPGAARFALGPRLLTVTLSASEQSDPPAHAGATVLIGRKEFSLWFVSFD